MANFSVDPLTDTDVTYDGLHFQLPARSVLAPTTLTLGNATPTQPLPTDFHLRLGFQLQYVGSPPPVPSLPDITPNFQFRGAGTITFSYAGLEDPHLPDTTLEVRQF